MGALDTSVLIGVLGVFTGVLGVSIFMSVLDISAGTALATLVDPTGHTSVIVVDCELASFVFTGSDFDRPSDTIFCTLKISVSGSILSSSALSCTTFACSAFAFNSAITSAVSCLTSSLFFKRSSVASCCSFSLQAIIYKLITLRGDCITLYINLTQHIIMLMIFQNLKKKRSISNKGGVDGIIYTYKKLTSWTF